MMAVKIIGIVLFVLILILLIPLTYSISFDKWKLTVKVGALFGIISKTKEIDPMKKKPKPSAEDEKAAEKELNEALDELDEKITSEAKPLEPEKPVEIKPAENPKKEVPAEEIPEEKKKENKKKKPSLLAQGRFALDNGLIKLVLIALAKIIDHGFPRRWQVEGKLGLPDPMYTGVLQGLLYATLPGAAEEIEWDYLETVFTLKGRGRGRFIPLYVLYILLKLAVSREAREFWHFRQGGKQNG
jgi:hypothetical protein